MKEELTREMVSVIAAAIAAFDKRAGRGLIIKSINRLPQTSPVWNIAGRMEYNNQRF